MNYSIINFEAVSKDKWDSFVESAESSFLWHTYDFILAMNTWYNHSNESFAIFDSNNDIVAIFPLYGIATKKFSILKRKLLDNIGGWLINAHNQDQYAEILIKEYIKKLRDPRCIRGGINFSTASLNYSTNPFFLNGLPSNVSYISVINLYKDLDFIWSRLRKGHRLEIKKAQKNCVTFRQASQEDLDTYYKMHEFVCSKSSIKPHNKKYFEHIFNVLLPQKRAYIGLAYCNGQPISAVNYGLHKDRAVYWTGASFPEAYKVGANHFLHWHMIQELKKNNFSLLDMGEVFFRHSSSKMQGIVNFKMGFGGDLCQNFKSILQGAECNTNW
jgi:hypothetical protein